MIKKIVKVILVLSLLSIGQSIADSSNGVSKSECIVSFKKANEFYKNKKYDEAIDQYKVCLAENLESTDLYYNLANSYFRNQEIGFAILFYEKALLLNPLDQDVVHNLKMARLKTKDKVAEDESNPMLNALYGVYNFIGIDKGLWFLLAIVFLTSIIIGFRIFYRGDREYLFYPIYGILFVIALLVSSALAYRIYDLEVNSYGVVVSKTTDVMSGPSDSFQVLNELNSGTKFQIIETNGDWLNVKIGESINGFVIKANVEKIQ